MSVLNIININKKNNMIEIKKSNYIKDKYNNGLFAKRNIKK